MRVRIILFAVFVFLTYKGTIHLLGEREFKKMSIDEFFKNGPGDHKYFELTDCYATGEIVYEKDIQNGIVKDISFAVLDSVGYFDHLLNEMGSLFGTSSRIQDEPKCQLIIKRDRTKYSSDCLNSENHTCLDDLINQDSVQLFSKFSIKGKISYESDEVDLSTRNLFASSGIKLDSNVALLTENEAPLSIIWCIAMLLGGLLSIYLLYRDWKYDWISQF